MASTPASPSPKRGVRGYFREKYNQLVRPHSRPPSQQSTHAEVSKSDSRSQKSSSTVGNFLSPPSNNPVLELHQTQSDPQISSSSRGAAWIALQTSLKGLHTVSAVFPPLESAIYGLISVLDVLESISKTRSEYDAIASDLKTLSESLTRHIKDSSSARMSDCIANVALNIEQQAKMINEKRDRGTGTRLMEARADEDEIVNHYRKIESLFRQLQTDANLSMWSIVNEQLANTRLEGLVPAKMANYDSKLSTEISRRACTQGTRTAILSEMNNWSLDPESADLYLMSGMAGTGKTTIACSFANRLDERKQLAASFFCTRTSPECRDASRILPTIAYQLARFSIPFQTALCEVLGRDPDIGSKNIAKQFERLLKEPLLKVRDAIPENLIVVIDALDECDDRGVIRLVLDLLFRFVPNLPLKFFVTSRPEPEIYNKMITSSPTSRTIFHLHEIEKSLVQADIELYLNEELSSISPTEEEIVQLATRSGNLFIYAATLVRYIRPQGGSVNPRRRLRSVLAIKPESATEYAEIDALYAAVLKSAFEQHGLNSEEAEDVRATLWTVLCAQEPISVDTLAALTGIEDAERTLSALQLLRSVVHLSEASNLVSTLHASFPDFMFNKERSGSLFCDPTLHNQLLATRCFIIMKAQLRFNICNIESSFIPDSKVENMEDRISKAISLTLLYACRYWANHLDVITFTNSNDLLDIFQEFLSIRLLFWIEVLSLRREIIRGLRILVKAKKWLRTMAQSPALVRFVEDAHNFLTGYAANPVSQYTPHIYISSLALCPRSSLVYKKYHPRTCRLIGLKGSGLDRLETIALGTWVISSLVQSVSYSPDGGQVAFGCWDGMVGVRNAYDGSPIIGPFKGHNKAVWSVAFSPDGTRFASCSRDCTIKVWNTQDGTPIGQPFQGHSDEVISIAFSLDGRLIASGSADKTVRIWNAGNGAQVVDPFIGHTELVRSVAFSPDGTQVVSGADDRTIRVWNTRDGTLVFDPLEGHTGTVRSVAFSPDGTRIASGSADFTIRIWHAQHGRLIVGPLKGHTKGISSVAFSPEGARLVSSSWDFTIRIWSSENGKLVAGPLEGHTNAISSVAFSPDGARVISGSGDETIRVWDAGVEKPILYQPKGHTDGITSIALVRGDYIASASVTSIYVWDSQNATCFSGPFEGHTGFMRSLAFSPDGKRLASGSEDRTVRVWDVNTGTPLASPFKAHVDAVVSVAFSSDGAYIASGSSDHTVRLWNSFDGSLIASPFRGHKNVVMSVAFSPDDTRIVSGSYDHTVRIWDTCNSTLVTPPFLGHTNSVMSVAFSPCGQYVVSGSEDFTIRAWNVTNGTLITDPFTGHTGVVRSVSFSPKGECIVSSSADCTVRVWHTYSGTLMTGPFFGHIDTIMSVAYFPDGARIVSGCWDGTIRIWELPGMQGIPCTSEHPPALPSLDLTHSATPPTDWIVKNDGWIMNYDGNPLFWASPEVIRCLLTPHCSSIISRFGMIEVDMSSALFGERWKECYVSVL
ncbi:hypothetical protein CTheo_7618 [Ceratobasidium theobromae]|uniref:NACHT domain-containing protein n=1 Tax=Ceratobasidium theobromae TaxID=1582974 RepID=A0A5N5QAX7_9AGAM|nr:hypothetical protein CTheo_7618 [Ceratobasidium theobromae]